LRAVLVPHSDIPASQQVPVDVRPDGVAHRLLDVLGYVDGWLAAGAGSAAGAGAGSVAGTGTISA